jgi:hypothetical protein
MNWNYDLPKIKGNYICDLGAYGIRLAWFDGFEWIAMWGSEKVLVYGWIEIPKHIFILYQ